MSKIKKVIKDLFTESITTNSDSILKDEILIEADNAKLTFQSKVRDLFDYPKREVEATIDSSLGKHSECMFFRYVDISEKDMVGNRLIYANAYKITFTMFITDNAGNINKSFEIEPSIHYAYTDAGLKYEPIKANTITGAVNQLIKWFAKNRDLILSVKK